MCGLKTVTTNTTIKTHHKLLRMGIDNINKFKQIFRDVYVRQQENLNILKKIKNLFEVIKKL